MRLKLDRNACQGHGLCAMVAETLFAISDEDGRALLLADPVPEAERDAARRAVASCPERAITIAEA